MFRNESDCFEIFQSQFGHPQISPFKFLSCCPCLSKKQDAGKDTSNAKRIFSDNVTCFGKNKSCSNRSHLPQCFIKALRFLLAWLLCFYMENYCFLFWMAIFAIPPIAPAVTIHTLPWKMRIQNVPCLFSMASSLVLCVLRQGHFVWCVVFLQCSDIESDCFEIFQSQFGNPQISPFKFLSCSPCWSMKQDAGMETSNAKRIFSDYVTCFATSKI